MIRGLWVLLPTLALGGESLPVIRVGDVAIGREAVAARARELRSGKVPFTPEQLVEALIDEAALAVEGRRMGLDKDPDVRAAIELESARLLAEHVVNSELTGAVKPPEERLRELFHHGSDTVSLELIVLATQPEAAAARTRLDQGGDFALEATRSLDPASSRNRGRTGPLSRIQLNPGLITRAFAEPVGSLFGPVELPNGWGVARVVERVIGDEAAYQARRAALVPMAQRQALAGAKEHYLKALRKKANAKVDEAFLKSLGKRVEVSGPELDLPFATLDGLSLKYRELLPSLRRFSAGQTGAHMLGGPVKTQLAWTLVDDRLLARDARARGVDKGPAVLGQLASAEVRSLASGMAARIGAGQPQGATPRDREAAIRKRIKKLRAELEIQVEQKSARAAASESGEGSAGK